MTGPTWDVRRVVLLRDQLACVVCGITVAVEDGDSLRPVEQYSIQHRTARGMGGSGNPALNHPTNLLTMCGTGTTGCHGYIEANPDYARTHGYRVDSWEAPETVPVTVQSFGEQSRFVLDGDTRVLMPGGAA